MSALQWGLDTLTLGRILDYRVSAVMTPDGIDYEATRYDVEFQGMLSTDLGLNAVANAKIIQQRFSQPRNTFRLYAGGINSPNPILESGAPDVRGGPVCNSVSVTNFNGTRTAIVHASFTIYKHDCATIPHVLSNRWSMDHSLDQDYYTRRTITGEMQINPYYRANADDLRANCFRGIPQGMQMVSGDFRQSPDGLRLRYIIVAQEKYQLPPEQTTDVRAEYTESSEAGAITMGEMYCDVAGPKTTSKAALIGIASNIVLSRFNFAGANKDTFAGGVIRETLHENRISVVVRAMKNQSNKLAENNPLRLDREVFGRAIPNAPPGKGQEIPVFGNVTENQAGISAVAAAWKSACQEGGAPTQAAATTNLPVGNGPVPPLSYSVEELPPPAEDSISPGQRTSPYTVSDIRVGYRRRTGQFPMPHAKKVDPGSGETRPRTVSIVRLTQPATYKEIYYRVERWGEKPLHPKVTVQPGETKIEDSFHVGNPQLAPDGVTPIYYGTGHIIVQIHGNVDIDSEDIKIAVGPETTFDILEEGTISPGDFDASILEGPP